MLIIPLERLNAYYQNTKYCDYLYIELEAYKYLMFCKHSIFKDEYYSNTI